MKKKINLRYIPVKGSLKAGDGVKLFTGEIKFLTQEEIDYDDWNDYSRVELFEVSRDINLGDTCETDAIKGTVMSIDEIPARKKGHGNLKAHKQYNIKGKYKDTLHTYKSTKNSEEKLFHIEEGYAYKVIRQTDHQRYFSNFINRCWWYHTHILEDMIGGESVEDLKKKYNPERVDFFWKWHLENKPKR